MYDFIDTTERAGERGYPVEAVSINGIYIEDEIPGYNTLYVSGRESLAKEISQYDTTKADGSQVNYTRFPARTMTVGFQLVAADANRFRLAFNELNRILNVEDAVITFHDELDKYFVGSPIFEGNVEPGKLSVTGEYQIFCADPFKYAYDVTVVETSQVYDNEEAEEYSASSTYEVGAMVKYSGRIYECITAINSPEAWNATHWSVMRGSAFVVDYDGGYKTFPDFEVHFAKDETSGKKGSRGNCGFVQFATDDSRIQFGDYDQPKYTTADIINELFTSSLGAFTGAAVDSAVPGTEFVVKGAAAASTAGLKPKYGTYKQNVWHGSFVTAPVSISNQNFKLEWQQAFIAAKKQLGLFAVMLYDASNNVIASVQLKKPDDKSTSGVVEYYIGNELKVSKTVDFGTKGAFGKDDAGKALRLVTNIITREENKLAIQLASDTQPEYFYGISTAIKKIGFFFGQYNAKTLLTNNELKFVRFADADAGNTFSSDDDLYISCSDASVYLNDKENLSLGDVGNEWSGMCIKPGINVIYVMLSDWVTAGFEPTLSMYYQKRWL